MCKITDIKVFFKLSKSKFFVSQNVAKTDLSRSLQRRDGRGKKE